MKRSLAVDSGKEAQPVSRLTLQGGNDGNNNPGGINDASQSHAAIAAASDCMSMLGVLATTPGGSKFLKGFAKGIAAATADDAAAPRPESLEIYLPDPMGTIGCMIVGKLMGLAMGDHQSEIPNPEQLCDMLHVLQQTPQTPPGSPRSLLDVVPTTPNMPYTPHGTPPVTPEGLPGTPTPTGTPDGPPPSTPKTPESTIKTMNPALKQLLAVPRPRPGPHFPCAGVLEDHDSAAASSSTLKMQ